MSDLPLLVLPETEKEEIFRALEAEVEESDLEQWREGDISVSDIMERYHISRELARKRMSQLVEKYPNKYRRALVILPNSFQNRRGYVIRALETRWSEVPRLESALLSEVALPKS